MRARRLPSWYGSLPRATFDEENIRRRDAMSTRQRCTRSARRLRAGLMAWLIASLTGCATPSTVTPSGANPGTKKPTPAGSRVASSPTPSVEVAPASTTAPAPHPPAPPRPTVTDDSCRANSLCSYDGRCFAEGNDCVAQESADCEASTQCEEEGWCTLFRGKCKPRTQEDCRRSKVCAKAGRCAFRGGRCSRSAEGCAKSEACRKYGTCALVDGPSGPTCAPTQVGHCLRSTDCRSKGECRLVRGPGCAPGGPMCDSISTPPTFVCGK
jgi:hypothetical protein